MDFLLFFVYANGICACVHGIANNQKTSYICTFSSRVRISNFYIFRPFFDIVYPKVRFRCSKPRVKSNVVPKAQLTFFGNTFCKIKISKLVLMCKILVFLEKSEDFEIDFYDYTCIPENCIAWDFLPKWSSPSETSVFIVPKVVFVCVLLEGELSPYCFIAIL